MNTIWMDSVDKEMRNNVLDFGIHDNIGLCIPVKAQKRYRKMTVHMIFYVKLDAVSTRKARLVADGHKVVTPPSMTYSPGVSIYSVRILILIAALNFLDFQCSDVKNTYLSAHPKERV